MRVLLALFVLAGLMAWPDPAAACAVCYGGTEESRTAFIVTTLFLSVLPVGMLGGIAWIVWRRIRDVELGSRTPEPPAHESVSRPS